jgi:hypothetical protein
MSQVIQIKRRIGGLGEPSGLALAELAYNTVENVLYIGSTGSTVQVLVGPSRQLELTGDQTIAIGARKTIHVNDLKVLGGADGYYIKTDGNGNIMFAQAIAALASQVPVSPPVGGADNVQAALQSLQDQIDALAALVTSAKET